MAGSAWRGEAGDAPHAEADGVADGGGGSGAVSAGPDAETRRDTEATAAQHAAAAARWAELLAQGATEAAPGGDDPSGDLGDVGGPAGTSTGLTGVAPPLPRLQSFGDCPSLLAGLRTAISARVGPYGITDRRGVNSADRLYMESSTRHYARYYGHYPKVVLAGASLHGGRGMFTEAQASEPRMADVVKTEGQRIITVTNTLVLDEEHENIVTVVENVDAESVAVSQVSLGPGGNNNGLLLRGDRALVLGDDPDGFMTVDEILLDGSARRGRTLQVTGRYVGAVSIDGTAHVIVASDPDESNFVFPVNAGGEGTATELNRRVVAESTLRDWLPEYTLLDGDGSVLAEGRPLACGRVYLPAEVSGFTVISLLTVDLDEPLAISDGVATFTDSGVVYVADEDLYLASFDYLYVAEYSWRLTSFVDPNELGGLDHDYRTSIHRFSLRADRFPVYEASGAIEGHVRDPSSLHEFGGNLYVATTLGSPWREGGQRASRLTVLRQRRDILATVGLARDIGRGKPIHAVRYIADRAYVESFSKDDPLLIVDLSSPSSPEVIGELAVPGYSTPLFGGGEGVGYLQPVGDGLLVGIGGVRDPTGGSLDLHVTLFDVAEAANPRAIDAWVLRNEKREVWWRHEGVLWWAPQELLFVPTLPWQQHIPYGSVVFRVDPDEGLERLGYVSLSRDSRSFLGRIECDHEFTYNATLKDSWASLMEDRGAVLLLVCGPRRTFDRADFTCEALDFDEAVREGIDLESLPMALQSAPANLRGGDRFEFCWNANAYAHPSRSIVRSLVIGDQLWSLGYWWLQSNDLDTLERRVRVDLPIPD